MVFTLEARVNTQHRVGVIRGPPFGDSVKLK